MAPGKNAGARFVKRVRVAALICMLVAAVIIGRLYYLQIIEGTQYTARADAQFILPQSPLTDRGSIYFTDKDGNTILAASLKDGFTLAINPSKITDAEVLYQEINAIIPIDHDSFIAKATQKDSQYQVVANHLDTSLGLKLQAANLPGVILAQDRWRVYPGGSLAAHEIGFVAYKGNTEEGRYGLEQEYNSTLSRVDGTEYANFFVQLFGGMQQMIEGKPQTGDIVTTIEPSVQEELERELAAYQDKWHPKLAGGIIMNPQDGSIYAMAVSPTFNLNDFGAQTNPSIYANPLVENIYEMGSIIKPLTMAAGIDSGVITATTTYNDTGCFTVDTKRICNWDFKARGVIPMQQVLSQSLNVGASFVATKMGPSVMRDYFVNHYQLGALTGIDLPGEQKGIISNLFTDQQVNYDTASFGQGIAMTPITTIRALATLANGGYLVTPHLVKAVNYDTGITKTLSWPKSGPVLKPQTTEEVTHMLTTVVDTVLAGGRAKMTHYSIAAKTGTAQIADPQTGGYYADKYLHSYFGYLPSYHAKFIIFLFAYEPVGALYSNETWSDTFIDLTRFLINYYNVPPDR